MRALGYPKVNSDNWYGLASPGGAPDADRKRLHDAAAQAMKSKKLTDA
jgi:tripartite-type tricarboxylate transporter receptor subunit TctC